MVKKFSNRLHWFTSQRVFNDTYPYKDTIAFRCKICKKTIKIRFPTFANLSHHLKLDEHSAFKRWLASQPDHVKEGRISDACVGPNDVIFFFNLFEAIQLTNKPFFKNIDLYKIFGIKTFFWVFDINYDKIKDILLKSIH